MFCNEHKTPPEMHVDASGHMGHYYIQEDVKSNVYRVEEKLGV